MKKKQILQILFFVLLALGITLSFFRMTKAFGFFIICIIQPIVALHYISIFKKEENQESSDSPLRYPLLLSLQITFVALLIKCLFIVMQWPFAGPVTVLVFGLAIVTVLLSIAFTVANRKIIKSVFIFEFVLMIFPILFLLGYHSPKEYSKMQYSKSLSKQYENLNQIEHTLYLKIKKDSLYDLSTVDFISKAKKDIIDRSGGVETDGVIAGSLRKFYVEDIEFEFRRKKREDLLKEIRREDPETVIECLNVLTKLQIDLLLKEKK